MRASTVMISSVALAVIGRWAHNKKTADIKAVVEVTFAIMFIAFLDQGKTEPIAKGFAWLFFAAVLLGSDSPITGIAKVVNGKDQSVGKVIGAAGAAGAAAIGGAGTAAGAAGAAAAKKIGKK